MLSAAVYLTMTIVYLSNATVYLTQMIIMCDQVSNHYPEYEGILDILWIVITFISIFLIIKHVVNTALLTNSIIFLKTNKYQNAPIEN